MANRPTNIETIEGMKRYIDRNKKTEYPFSYELWDLAIEESKLRNEKILSDNQKRLKQKPLIPIGNIYFELVNQEQYKGILENAKFETEDFCDVSSILDLNTEEGAFMNALIQEYFSYVTDPEDLNYLIARIKDYYGEYEFNAGSDKFLVVTVISDELAIMDFQKRRLQGEEVTKELSDTRKSYMQSLDGLKALKKLSTDDSKNQNSFSAWVDVLTKEGKLAKDMTVYEDDKIQELMESQDRSIANAMS